MTPLGASLWAALLVGTGGTLGALSRFGVDAWLGPRGVLVVNVAGSLLLGALVTASVDSHLLLVFGTGFCGAFTTFSSFTVRIVEHARAGERLLAARYAALTFVAALAGVAVGGVIGQAVV